MRGSDGQYTSARKQDASVLDRFIVIEWNYDETLEVVLASNINASHGLQWAKYIQKVRKYVSNPSNGIKTQFVVGTRAIIFGAKLLALPRYQNNKALLVQAVLTKYGVDATTVERIVSVV